MSSNTRILIKKAIKTPTDHILKQSVSEERRFKINTILNRHINSIMFQSPTSIYDPIFVDPKKIEYANLKPTIERGLGQVQTDNWDHQSNNEHLSQHWINKGLMQRFLEDYEWEETIYFKKAKKTINERGSMWGYDTINEFYNIRCSYVDDLFESMAQEGYLSNYKESHNVPSSDIRHGKHHHLEPLISIDRCGKLLLRDGRHRVTLAQILEIDEIPVNVLSRHFEWQTKREKIYSKDERSHSNKERDHPDFQF